MPIFLLTDIEGSTQLWQQSGDAMGRALAQHDELIRVCLENHHGRFLKHTGDGVLAIFDPERASNSSAKGVANGPSNGDDPLGCALAVQSAMATAKWDLAEPLWVRVALHAGEAENRQVAAGHTDYFGLTITRLARLISAAWGGQILVTPGVLAGARLPEGAVLHDQGVHTLKDLYEPQRIFQVTADYLPDRDHRPLRTLSARTTNLQAQATPFVGRETELQQIAELLAEPDCRLLTIIGPGGMGKSRLAVQAAAEAVDQFADGVYNVPLEPVLAPDLVPAAIAESLGLRLPAQGDGAHALAGQIGERQVLVVLDGIEHLLEDDATGQVVEDRASHQTTATLLQLLAGAPHLKFLVTSRQRLNVQAEWLLRLEGLSFATADTSPSAEPLSAPVLTEAMALFVQGARRSKPDFHPTPEDEAAIATIGTLLGGMPLGIELAAAWVRHLAPAEIAAAIAHDEGFLAASEQDRVERQRSLATVFEYAWQHLHADEQQILDHLAIFEEPFRHGAAEQVAGATLSQLLGLVDKSVLLRTPAGRYALHPLWREFVRRKGARGREEREERGEGERSEGKRKEEGREQRGEGGAAVRPTAVVDGATSEPTAGGRPDRESAVNPYKGLRPFEAADAGSFFGREALTEALLARLAEPGTNGRFLAVVGPSGSGKSSVVKAGLLPQLATGALPGSDRWRIVQLTPGKYPVDELAIALQWALGSRETDLVGTLRRDERGLLQATERLLAEDPRSELVLVLDQFEELFTLCEDDSVRQFIMDSVLVGVRDPASRLRVVVTLRADFLDRPLQYGGFGELLRERTAMVVPLSPAELERAVVEPAQAAGVTTDLDLVATVIADVSEEVGALPLLQYALYALFDRREGGRLTLEAYRRLGGVSGAMAGRADALYEAQDGAGREATRQLFLRLVTLGEGSEDTRRRTSQAELDSAATDREAMHKAIGAYAEHRLLTLDRDPATGGPTVEVAHEAIIREWGRLRDWLDESREDLRLQRGLARGADEWAASGRDASFLLQGSRLTQLEAWAAGTTVALTAEERAYLDASTAARLEREAAETLRQKHETELETRGRQLLRLIAGGSAVAAVVAGLLAFSAWRSNERAQQLRMVSQSQKLLAQGLADPALAVALEALSRAGDLPEAELAVSEAAYAPGTKWMVKGDVKFTSLAVSPNGETLISGDDGDMVQLWDARTGKSLRTLAGHANDIVAVAWLPDGKHAISGASDGRIIEWDVQSGEVVKRLQGDARDISSLALSPDGNFLLTGSSDRLVRLWDLKTGAVLKELKGHASVVMAVAFTHDGGRAVSSEVSSTDIILWNLSSGQEVRRLRGQLSGVPALAVSPDDRFVAGIGYTNDTATRLWDLATGQLLHVMPGHTGAAYALAFSPDGMRLASGAFDATVRLWDPSSAKQVGVFAGHTGSVQDIAFSPDGRQLYSAALDGSIRCWNLTVGTELFRQRQTSEPDLKARPGTFHPSEPSVVAGYGDGTARIIDFVTGQQLGVFSGHAGLVHEVAFSPDGQWLATGSFDSKVRLWTTSNRSLKWQRYNRGAAIHRVAFSPDGSVVAGGTGDGVVTLWDAQTGEELARLPMSEGRVRSLGFTPDGRRIVAAVNHFNFQDEVQVWQLPEGRLERRLAGPTNIVTTGSVSPDGRLAAAGGADRTVRVWDIQSGREVSRIEFENIIWAVAFSPDGKLAIAPGGAGVTIWDVRRNAPVRRYNTDAVKVTALAFDPTGQRLLGVDAETATTFVWQVHHSRQELLDWIQGNRVVHELTCFERTLYSLHRTCAADGTPPAPLAFPAAPVSPALTNGDQSSAAVGHPTLADMLRHRVKARPIVPIIDTPTRTLQLHRERISSVSISPDRRYFVTSAGNTGATLESQSNDNSAALWDLESGRLVRRFVGHTRKLNCAVVSPDRMRLVTCSADRLLILWDIATGKALWQHETDTAGVNRVRFDSSGDRMTYGERKEGGHLVVLDSDSGQVLTRIGPQDYIVDLAYSPDNQSILAASEYGGARLWDVETEQAVATFGGGMAGHTRGVRCVTFDASGQLALTGGGDGLIILWDVTTAKELRRFEGHSDGVNGVVFDSSSRRLVSISADLTTRVWDVATGTELRRFRTPDGGGLALTPDGRHAISGGQDGTLALWPLDDDLAAPTFDSASGKPIAPLLPIPSSPHMAGQAQPGLLRGELVGGEVDRWTLTNKVDQVLDVRASADAPVTQTLDALARMVPGRLDLHIAVRTVDGTVVAEADDQPGGKPDPVLTNVILPANGTVALDVAAANTIATGGYTLTIASLPLVRPSRTIGEPFFRRRPDAMVLKRLALTPDGAQALVGGGNVSSVDAPLGKLPIDLWSLATGQLQLTLNAERAAHWQDVGAVAISPEGRAALSGSRDGHLVLWSLATGRETRRFAGHNGAINAVAFSRDGLRAVSGSSDHRLVVWDVATGAEIRRFDAITDEFNGVAFTPDGQTVVASTPGGKVLIWDPTSGGEPRALVGSGASTGFALTPDGTAAVLGADDGTVAVWNLAAGAIIRRMVMPSSIHAVAVSPSGAILASGAYDGTISLWRLPSGEEVARLLGHTDDVRDLAFTPDGRRLVSVAFDGTLRVWEVGGAVAN